MPFTAQSGPAAAVGTEFRPVGTAGLVCRRGTRLARCTLATGIGRSTTVIAGFVGYVAVRIARTRSADAAGVGRGTSVVTGNRRRTAIGVGFTGGTLRTTVVRRTAVGAGLVGNVTVGIGLAGGTTVTGVVSGTAIGTTHGRNRTFRPHLTSIVITVARFSGRSVFPVTVRRVLTVFRFTDASIILSVARTAGNGIFS